MELIGRMDEDISQQYEIFLNTKSHMIGRTIDDWVTVALAESLKVCNDGVLSSPFPRY